MSTLATARSFLFAPGSDERKLSGALEAGADAVIADLEDAVVPEEKERARALVADALAAPAGSSLRLVRVNGAGSPWLDDDLAMVAALDVDGVVLPKATPEALRRWATACPWSRSSRPPSACTVPRRSRARRPVESLMLGAIDLALELGSRGAAGRARAAAGAVDDRARVRGRPASRPDRPCLGRREGRERARGGLPSRTESRLPRQVLHPPGPGGRRERGLLAVAGRGRPCPGRGRRLRARARPRGGAPSRSTGR